MAENNYIKHAFVSPKSDGPDTTLVRPSNWNDGLVFAGGVNGQILVFDNTQDNNMRWVDGTKALNDLQTIANPTTSPYNAAVSISFTSVSPVVIVASASYLGVTTVGAATINGQLHVDSSLQASDTFASGISYFAQRIVGRPAGVHDVHIDLIATGGVNFTGGLLYLTVLAFGV